MSVKHGWTSAVFLSLLAGGIASAQLPTDLSYLQERGQAPADQAPYLKSTPPQPTPLPEGVTPSTQVPQTMEPPALFDGYTVSNLPACLWPVGGNGPIGYDVYFRTGPSFLTGGGALKEALDAGWEVQGGGRSLFYNVDGSSAWTVDVGVTYTYNDAHNSQIFTPMSNTLPKSYTVRDLERTSVGAALGKDWFLYGPGFIGGSPNWNFFYGIAAGGRWGTMHVNLTPTDNPEGYARNQTPYGEYFLAVHADLQVPMGGWMFLLGVRGEFSYTSDDVLPGANSNMFNMSFLFTSGFRF